MRMKRGVSCSEGDIGVDSSDGLQPTIRRKREAVVVTSLAAYVSTPALSDVSSSNAMTYSLSAQAGQEKGMARSRRATGVFRSQARTTRSTSADVRYFGTSTSRHTGTMERLLQGPPCLLLLEEKAEERSARPVPNHLALRISLSGRVAGGNPSVLGTSRNTHGVRRCVPKNSRGTPEKVQYLAMVPETDRVPLE